MIKFLYYTESLLSQAIPFALIIFGGLYISIKGRFFQLKGLFSSFNLVKKAIKAPKKKGETTSFSAACTALSATVGTGNIAGVAGAISLGGAGAVFWMCISSILGMAIKYGEISLSIKYRKKIHTKEYIGGPMYYIRGFNSNKSIGAIIFSLTALPAVFCSGNITQTNAAATVIKDTGAYKYLIGIAFFLLTHLIIQGGITRVGAVTEKIVPIMSFLYIFLCIGVIILNYKNVPSAFEMIIKGAFTPKAVTGGAIGSAFQSALIGASRGVFSNEAGLGTSAMAHSVAYDANSETQGLFGIFEIFIDTIILCTLTALTILCSGVNIEYGRVASCYTVSKALSSCYGHFSTLLLCIMMCVFAFSSIIGWAVYGFICTDYIFGIKGQRVFRLIYPLGCLVGAIFQSELSWRLSALFNGIMLCANVPSVIFMTNEFLTERGNSLERKSGKNTVTSKQQGSSAYNK